MTREDIIRMAREAGMPPVEITSDKPVLYPVPDAIQRFAAFVAGAERDAIMDEWWMCVNSDLENGVKSLNERAAEKWHKEYPAMAGFDAAIRTRGQE